MLGLCCCAGFSLAVARGYSLVAGHELLIAVASLVGEHGLYGMQASVVVAHGLMFDLPGPGIKSVSPALAGGFFHH